MMRSRGSETKPAPTTSRTANCSDDPEMTDDVTSRDEGDATLGSRRSCILPIIPNESNREERGVGLAAAAEEEGGNNNDRDRSKVCVLLDVARRPPSPQDGNPYRSCLMQSDNSPSYYSSSAQQQQHWWQQEEEEEKKKPAAATGHDDDTERGYNIDAEAKRPASDKRHLHHAFSMRSDGRSSSFDCDADGTINSRSGNSIVEDAAEKPSSSAAASLRKQGVPAIGRKDFHANTSAAGDLVAKKGGGKPATDDRSEKDYLVNNDGTPDSAGFTKNFPQRLMEVLSCKDTQNAIVWMPDGLSFVIISPREFASSVLPIYFRQTKFASFTRKLNRWGFKRITKGPSAGAYFHSLFQRDRPDLCQQMFCRKSGESTNQQGPSLTSNALDQFLIGDSALLAARRSFELRRHSMGFPSAPPPRLTPGGVGAVPRERLFSFPPVSSANLPSRLAEFKTGLLGPEWANIALNSGRFGMTPDVAYSLEQQAQSLYRIGGNPISSAASTFADTNTGMFSGVPLTPQPPTTTERLALLQQLEAFELARRRSQLDHPPNGAGMRDLLQGNSPHFSATEAHRQPMSSVAPSVSNFPSANGAVGLTRRLFPGSEWVGDTREDMIADKTTSSNVASQSGQRGNIPGHQQQQNNTNSSA